jgi:hypothetical protein
MRKKNSLFNDHLDFLKHLEDEGLNENAFKSGSLQQYNHHSKTFLCSKFICCYEILYLMKIQKKHLKV